METVGWILLAFAAVRLAVSTVNLVSRPYPGRNGRLKAYPSVSILIPARNEEHNIGNLLGDLRKEPYPKLEILVYDDASSDGTARTVETAASEDTRIHLIRGSGPPQGWLGKNHACHRLAEKASGEMFLFLDADVRLRPGFMEKTLASAESHGSRLLSVFPRQIMPGIGTRTVVPLMNRILLSLLPLIAVRLSPLPSLAAANGQFMLFDSAAYRATRPHEKFRNSPVEDMAIVKEYKRSGFPVTVLLGDADISCRMYGSAKEAVGGFSKNVFEFFGGSAVLAFAYASATALAPAYAFIWPGPAGGLACCIMAVSTNILVSVASRQSVAWNLLLAVPQQATLLIIVCTALLRRHKKRLMWKGRNVLSEQQS